MNRLFEKKKSTRNPLYNLYRQQKKKKEKSGQFFSNPDFITAIKQNTTSYWGCNTKRQWMEYIKILSVPLGQILVGYWRHLESKGHLCSLYIFIQTNEKTFFFRKKLFALIILFIYCLNMVP